MKLQFATTASVILLAALSVLPAQAAPATFVSIGQSAAADCAQAADAQSRNRLIESGRQAALANCDQALAGTLSEKNRTATFANRGILEAAADKTDAAIADFNAALSRDPGLADIYINRGATQMRAGRNDEARADFDHAIALHASNVAIAYFDRGMANEKAGNVKAAYSDYRQAQALQPDFQPVLAELARFRTNNVAQNK